MAESLLQLRSRYTWDAARARYRNPAGRFVSEAAVKQALIRFVRKAQREVEALAREVAAGTLDVAEWQTATAFRLKNIHLAMRAAARGGWAQLDASDFGRVGAELRRQYERLAVFASDVAGGRMTSKAIVARSSMYGAAGNATYERGRFDSFDDVAKTGVIVEMRNVLGIGEHCQAGNGKPGCKEESERGWVAMGELTLPGSRRCLTRCRCSVRYRTR